MTVPLLFDAHHHPTREFWLSFGSSASVSQLLLPISCSLHTTPYERGRKHSPSPWPLFRTDDRSSQHRIRLGQAKAVIELTTLAVPRRLTELLGQGVQSLVAGSVSHFACVQQAHGKAARIGEQPTS